MDRETAGRQQRVAGWALLPGGRLIRAIVHLADGRVAEVEADPPRAAERALRSDRATLVLGGDEVLAPAFIDIHCHGAGGGAAYGDPASLELMARALHEHGVGAFLATAMTAPIPELLAAARRVGASTPQHAGGGSGAPRATALGVHLEGPVLSRLHSAGHDPAALAAPADLAASLAREPDAWRHVRIVTLAPELAGGLELVRKLVGEGVVVSVGHTDATAEVASAAYAAGARSTTHLFNGMPGLRHRAPGPVGAALADAPFIELISDGVHVDTRLLAPIARAIGEERLILVSDALPLAGSRLRSVRTPGSTACIRGGRAVHPDGTLAGGLLLLDGIVSAAVRSGIPLAQALRAATENPARLLDLPDRGVLAAGAVADLVVVSGAGRLRRVLAAASAP